MIFGSQVRSSLSLPTTDLQSSKITAPQTILSNIAVYLG